MACSCSKKAQPTGFAVNKSASTESFSAQAAQRAGAGSVPGAIAPTPAPRPTGSR